ncbi:MAG: hypothetical protein COV35_07270 [Alphaproteobacteria bacterium CG11_big_fil_rev_8_21_14_0_20_39_49]|nr:MAG: hypothetical protein COV35_07270 [Alphaproteobacteria bacterium CG11_big_fil_rev_8_21_14_0_20_39_49]
MNAKFKSPFSGDVTQAINPWQWWGEQWGNNSASLINITNYKSEAPATEAAIIEGVAGYGMQLGKIIYALEVVIETLPSSNSLNKEQKDAVKEFKEMAAKIEETKKQKRLQKVCNGNVEQLIAGLKTLKEENKEEYNEVAKRLKAVL